MQSPEYILSSEELRRLLGADVMPLFRLLFAQMAASCATLASALREAASGKQVPAAPSSDASSICCSTPASTVRFAAAACSCCRLQGVRLTKWVQHYRACFLMLLHWV